MTQLLETRQPHSVKGLQDIMRDKHGFPDSICFHPNPNDPPEERYMTVTAVVMDLQTHEIWLSDGPPDENPFEHHRLG
jgi:isopenicillin-N N-acyltransferase-like protein